MMQSGKDKPYHDLQKVYARHPLGAPESDTFIEILKCHSLPGLLQISHRFETFLSTLYREVQKRAVLQQVPVDDDLREVDASI